jgi:hypothetical protein
MGHFEEFVKFSSVGNQRFKPVNFAQIRDTQGYIPGTRAEAKAAPLVYRSADTAIQEGEARSRNWQFGANRLRESQARDMVAGIIHDSAMDDMPQINNLRRLWTPDSVHILDLDGWKKQFYATAAQQAEFERQKSSGKSFSSGMFDPMTGHIFFNKEVFPGHKQIGTDEEVVSHETAHLVSNLGRMFVDRNEYPWDTPDVNNIGHSWAFSKVFRAVSEEVLHQRQFANLANQGVVSRGFFRKPEIINLDEPRIEPRGENSIPKLRESAMTLSQMIRKYRNN